MKNTPDDVHTHRVCETPGFLSTFQRLYLLDVLNENKIEITLHILTVYDRENNIVLQNPTDHDIENIAIVDAFGSSEPGNLARNMLAKAIIYKYYKAFL